MATPFAEFDGTLDSLIQVILIDIGVSMRDGTPRKYPSPLEVSGDLMDMMLPTGKPLGKSTSDEVRMVGEAYLKIGQLQAARLKGS